MIKKTKICLFIVLALFVFVSCVSRVLDFTIVSNKNVDLRIKDSAKGQRVTGVDSALWILFIPTGSPNLEEAVDKAIEKAGPGYDALMDGVIYSEFFTFLLVSRSGYKVEGTPVKTREIIADLSTHNILYHSSLGIDNKKAIQRIGVTKVR